MNKKIKTLIIGGIVLVVLLGAMIALMVVNNQGGERSSSSSSDSTVNIVEKNIDNITKIVIHNPQGEVTLTQPEEGSFAVETLGTLPLETTDVKSVFSNLAVIDATKVVSETPGDLEEYGLTQPQTTAEVFLNDGSSYTLRIGNESPLGDGYYAMLDGDDKLYLISSATYETHCTYAAKDFVYRTLAANEEDAEIEDLVKSVEFYRKDFGQTLYFDQLENDPDVAYSPVYASAYTMTSPIKAFVDGDNFYNVAGVATSLRADAVVAVFPTEEELAKYGFDDPQAVYTAGMTDGSTFKLYVGNTVTGGLDGSTANEVGYYVIKEGIDAIFYMDDYQLTFMGVSEFELLSQVAFAPELNSLSSMEVVTSSATYDFAFTHTTETNDQGTSSATTTTTLNGSVMDEDLMKNLYMYVISALAEGIYTDTPSGNAVAAITFHATDSSVEPLTVEFHDIGNRKASITINGQTRFHTRMTYVTNLLSNLEAAASGGEVNPNY